MEDDGTLTNRMRRDGAAGAQRGSSQTHGAGDASGVDVEPEVPPIRFAEQPAESGGDALPPSSGRSS